MEFIHGIENYPKARSQQAVVTIGTFDGIHRGHQAILKRVMQLNDGNKYEPVLVTFHPHPKVLVAPEHIPLLLTTSEEKKKFIPHFFDGKVLTLQFDDQLMEMSAEEFVKKILVETVGASKAIVGYDHAFGNNRSGTIEMLKQFGDRYDFEVEVVGPVKDGDEIVSSSVIRKAMLTNQYEKAIHLLGHQYAIYGKVERGLGLGRKLGYPTANVAYNMRKLLPPEGVYACWAQIDDEERFGMMFIGKNHFNPQQRVTVEANLFDFDRDIYDQEIIVYPTTFIRNNRKYDSTEKLVEQIKLDKNNVLQLIHKESEDDFKQRAKSSNY